MAPGTSSSIPPSGSAWRSATTSRRRIREEAGWQAPTSRAADSDSNIYTGTTPGGSNYIGQHPGTAFMEMQFYPPGWTTAVTNSCDATRWCAALTIDSLSQNLNTGGTLNSSCANRLFGGTEYINFAYITKTGCRSGRPTR